MKNTEKLINDRDTLFKLYHTDHYKKSKMDDDIKRIYEKDKNKHNYNNFDKFLDDWIDVMNLIFYGYHVDTGTLYVGR